MIAAQEVRLVLLGWNFRAAGQAVRESVAFTAEEVGEGLKRLITRGVTSEAVIVSTCHRSEIYSLTGTERANEEIARVVSEWRGLDLAELSRSSFHREGADAARHLFRVAAGLDSMALGESEVLGQVRQALRLARDSGATRSVLHRLFESAVAAGKRVRAETEIAMHPLSLPSIGFELAGKVFGELPARTILLLGAGETGTLFARHAIEAGVRDLRVANRTPARARELTARLGGRAVLWEEIPKELAIADVVVGTTASPQPVVRRSEVEAAMRLRRGKPMFFLDLAMPPDVERSVAEIYNVFLYGLDDLEQVADGNRRRRAREIPRAEEILDDELKRFFAWFGNLSVIPTLTDLRRRFDQARDEELSRVSAADRERFQAFADAIAARLLHEPMRRLKSESDSGRKLDRVEAVRHLFKLDE